jgi:hypothetical protein
MSGMKLIGDELVRRLNCIAANAIREAQIAKGRGDLPWLDDDWARMDMISRILDIHDPEDLDLSREHMPLATEYQAPKNVKLDQLGKLLAEALENPILDEPEPEVTDSVTQTKRPALTKK